MTMNKKNRITAGATHKKIKRLRLLLLRMGSLLSGGCRNGGEQSTLTAVCMTG